MNNKLIVTYDIKNDKLRTHFSKYLSKFGYRLQYSVFEIRNSDRILENIKAKISGSFENSFDQNDSVIIFHLGNSTERICYGYAKNEQLDLLIV
jgi:CRISPR-associated protein Cas2